MTSNKENFAPYTSIGNMLLILGRIRKGWIPGQIDKGEMIRVGITEGNANRTMAALEYFGLTNEDNKTTDIWKAIATSTTNDYPKVLEGILRNSYPTIFDLHPNPAEASDLEISNAFAKSEPLNQRGRMVTLFRGLCQEAGLIEGEPLTRERKPIIKQTNQNKTEINVDESKSNKTNIWQPSTNITPSLKWYNDLETLMSRLPNPEKPKWTKGEKDRWLTALQSMLELLIETTNEE